MQQRKGDGPGTNFHRVFDGLPDLYDFVNNRPGQRLFCTKNLPHNHGFRDELEMLGKIDLELFLKSIGQASTYRYGFASV